MFLSFLLVIPYFSRCFPNGFHPYGVSLTWSSLCLYNNDPKYVDLFIVRVTMRISPSFVFLITLHGHFHPASALFFLTLVNSSFAVIGSFMFVLVLLSVIDCLLNHVLVLIFSTSSQNGMYRSLPSVHLCAVCSIINLSLFPLARPQTGLIQGILSPSCHLSFL